MATASVPALPKASIGAYKDLQTVRYSKEKELEGTGNFAAATYPHYLPVWVSGFWAAAARQFASV